MPFTADLGTCNVAVAAGRNCRLNVTLHPTAPLGAKTGTVTIVSNAIQQPDLRRASTRHLEGRRRSWSPPSASSSRRLPTSVKPVNVSLRVSTAATIRLQVRTINGKLVWSKSVKAKQAGTAKLTLEPARPRRAAR